MLDYKVVIRKQNPSQDEPEDGIIEVIHVCDSLNEANETIKEQHDLLHRMAIKDKIVSPIVSLTRMHSFCTSANNEHLIYQVEFNRNLDQQYQDFIKESLECLKPNNQK